MPLFNSLMRSPLTASGLSKYTKRCYKDAQRAIAPDVPWWPALLTIYIRPCPLPACRSCSTLSIPPWGSIQSCSPSGTVNFCNMEAMTTLTNESNRDRKCGYPIHKRHACVRPRCEDVGWIWIYQNRSLVMLIIELTYAIFPRSLC